MTMNQLTVQYQDKHRRSNSWYRVARICFGIDGFLLVQLIAVIVSIFGTGK